MDIIGQLVKDTEAWEKERQSEMLEFIKTKWHKPGVGKFKFRVLPGSYMFAAEVPGLVDFEKARMETHKQSRHMAAQIRKRLPKHMSGIHLKFVEKGGSRGDYVTNVNVFQRLGVYVAVQSHCDEDDGLRVWRAYPKFDEFLCHVLQGKSEDSDEGKSKRNQAIVELQQDEEEMEHMVPIEFYLTTLKSTIQQPVQ